MENPRHLPLDGAYNTRDLGGYETRDGSRTQWRRFLRSDSPHRLTDAARATLVEQHGLRTIIDLRRTSEVRQEPNGFGDDERVSCHHINMSGDDIGEVPDGPGAEALAHDYTSELTRRRHQIGRILQTLADAGDHLVLYHCAVGQDRTGVISALLLDLAGVPDETIAADYALTARYLVDPYRAAPGTDPSIRSWRDYQERHCPPEAMLTVMSNLERRYGGTADYLRDSGLSDLQIRRLRSRLLEP